MDSQCNEANNAMAEAIDFYMDVVPITELFLPRNEGNKELYMLFEDIFISEKTYRAIPQPMLHKITDYRICHREVYDEECEEFQSRLIACAENKNARIKVMSNGFFSASCRSCCSSISTFLDSGCLNLCKHEIALLLGVDYQMSMSHGYYSYMRTERLEALKTRRSRILERFDGVHQEKAVLLSRGVASIEKDFSDSEHDRLKFESKSIYNT